MQPEIVTQVEAWRAWNLVHENLGQEVGVRLRSGWNTTIWEPGQVFYARCLDKRTPHPIPGEGCRCGVYAARWTSFHSEASGVVAGRVALGGRVIMGEYAHRAENAYPLSFEFMQCAACSKWLKPADTWIYMKSLSAACYSCWGGDQLISKRRNRSLGKWDSKLVVPSLEVLEPLTEVYQVELDRSPGKAAKIEGLPGGFIIPDIYTPTGLARIFKLSSREVRVILRESITRTESDSGRAWEIRSDDPQLWEVLAALKYRAGTPNLDISPFIKIPAKGA